MENAYSIKIPVFEGPLDLLLHLIREHKMDIYDIQISLITEQYLEYIELMKELNLEIAGEFLVVAATLIHIKSRMLLPIEETADTDEPEDPRLELVMKLLEYKSFKDAALQLQEKEDEWSEVIPRTPLPEEEQPEEDAGLSLFDLNLFDLLSAFNKLYEKAPPEARIITKEVLTVKDKMNLIIETLKASTALRFESLFKDDSTLPHFLVTFIALLELIKLGLAKAYQKEGFSSIWIINPEAEVNYDDLAGKSGNVAPQIKHERKEAPSGIIKDIVMRSRRENVMAKEAELAVLAPERPRAYKPMVILPALRQFPVRFAAKHRLPSRAPLGLPSIKFVP